MVTDQGVIAAGWLADVQQSLESAGVPHHVFLNITPNPRSTEVMEGADVYRKGGL